MDLKEGMEFKTMNGSRIVILEIYSRAEEFLAGVVSRIDGSIRVVSTWDFTGENLEKLPGYNIAGSHDLQKVA